MSSPRQDLLTMERKWGGHRARGFTLLELALTLLIIGLAVGLGLLLVGQSLERRRGERLIADLQTFSAAFQDYHRQRGAWPPSTSRDVTLPRGMEDILKETPWTGGSPFGGSYGWVQPGPVQSTGRDSRGAVVLTAFSPNFPLELSRADLLEIDRRIDDGDLTTGRFRTGFNGWPVYLVEDKP